MLVKRVGVPYMFNQAFDVYLPEEQAIDNSWPFYPVYLTEETMKLVEPLWVGEFGPEVAYTPESLAKWVREPEYEHKWDHLTPLQLENGTTVYPDVSGWIIKL